MKITDVILEGRDAPLYHFADEAKISHLTQYDELEGNWEHDLSQWLGKRVTGISLTRNKRLLANDSSKWARIELDQTKLTQRYRLIPLEGDYAHWLAGQLSPSQLNTLVKNPTMQKDQSSRYRFRRGLDWNEEFLLGSIKPASKYIKNISINETTLGWLGGKTQPTHRYLMYQELTRVMLFDYASRKKIPLTFYDGSPVDPDEFAALKKNPRVIDYLEKRSKPKRIPITRK